MSKLIVLVYSLIFSAHCFSQSVDSIIKLEINKFQRENINEIGYTTTYCGGGLSTTETVYLFWTVNNNTYIQKFEGKDFGRKEIVKSQAIKITDSVFFHFYKKNSESLLSEKVMPFNYELISNVGKVKKYQIITSSGSCIRNIKLYLGNFTFSKSLDLFDIGKFDTEQIDNSTISKEIIKKREDSGWEVDTNYKNTPIRNKHYEANKDLKIVEWDSILTKFIKKLEIKNEFIEMEYK